jgi:biopolymer transport protein ExbB
MITNILLQITTLPSVTDKPNPVNDMSLLELLMKGGWVLYPIILISLLSVYIMVAKYFEIRTLTKIDESIVNGMKSSLRKGDIEQANSFVQHGNSSYSRVFAHALANIGKPVKEIENAIESASEIEVNKMTRNIHYLGLFAGIAPMLGFIGTIAGVIKIFYSISITDNISIGIISGGLYQKMISSGTGLIVGVIAYTAYHILNIMIDKYLSRIQVEAFDFVNIIQSK